MIPTNYRAKKLRAKKHNELYELNKRKREIEKARVIAAQSNELNKG